MNVFLTPADFSRKGDVLTESPHIVLGELVEAEAEKFVREKLGLPAEESKVQTKENAGNDKIEVCSEEDTALKKIGEN